MSYRIDYQPVKKVRGAEKRRSSVISLAAVLLILLAVLVNICWPEGRRILQTMFIPADADVTVSALETMAGDLKAGLPLAEAFRSFCLLVMTG